MNGLLDAQIHSITEDSENHQQFGLTNNLASYCIEEKNDSCSGQVQLDTFSLGFQIEWETNHYSLYAAYPGCNI